MITTQYSHDEILQLKALLKQHHSIRIVVRLLDLNHNYLQDGDLSSAFAGGQVNFDDGAEITRSLDLTLFDPARKIHLDTNSPQRLAVYIDKMVSVVYVVTNPTRTKVFSIPVFCGPIDGVDRNDAYINVKALGKESLSIGNLWHGKKFGKGQEKTTVIKRILTLLVGETKISIADRTSKIPNEMTLNRSSAPWKVAKKLARSMGLQLFYDGRGVARTRVIPKHVSWTFDESALTSVPQFSYDLTRVVNAVEVNGHKGKKGKGKVQYRAIAQNGHPLSPRSLGRGNPVVPRFLWMVIDDQSVRTEAEAKRRAKKELEKGLRGGVDATYDGLPVPLLEEGDVVRLNYAGAAVEHPMRAWTLPLTADGDSSYGYIKRPPIGRRRAVRHRGTTKRSDS